MTRMTLFFFSSGVEKECLFFFSFYKLTSCPFFLISPLQSQSVDFFIYLSILCHPSTPIFCLFIFFLSLSSSFISRHCPHLLCLMFYRSLCTCESVNYMSCPCLLFFFFIPSFLWVLLRLDKKG